LPVLISDRTPFLDLERWNAGWSLPLDVKSAYVDAIEALSKFDPATRLRLRQGARELAVQVVQESDAVSRSRAMIWQALTSDDAKRRSHDRRT
jgi:hypothetical protein